MEQVNNKATEEKQRQNFIDINKVFKKKGGKLYPLIPGFLISYIKRITHQDEINAAIERLHDKWGLDFVNRLIEDEFCVDVNAENPENIPEKGRYIIASNHPLGGLDGIALMYATGKKRKDIKFIVNDILFELQNLQELFIPINKHGRNTYESVRLIEEIFESDQLVLIFPAGLVSRRQNGRIRDLAWKKSFINKAIKHKRDVIPVHIQGKNSNFFYNLANIRKKLGVKLNIEMLYLPDEMFKQGEKNINITFGKPIPYTMFTKEKTHYEWAQMVKEHVYGLKENKPQFFV